jgi:DNA invertase Pin-like site-specific DNA recombinase
LNDPDMQQVLRDLERADVSGVCVSALDRLFRPNFYSDFAILDFFQRTGKRIWSSKEGLLDPGSDAGFMMSLFGGAQAALEWRELRRRTTQGKQEFRLRGGCPDAGVCIPRGVTFDRNPDKETRRANPGTWRYCEPDASRVKRMFELILQGKSYHSIAREVGGGWSHQGIKSALRNRIWLGERVYPAKDGRGEPLVVKVISKPLVSVAVWEAAQRELDARKNHWRKSKQPRRFLVSGLVLCARCGKPCYLQCKGGRRPRRTRDYYYCSSLRRGPACGARSWQREGVDAAVRQLVTEDLCQPAVLRAIVEAAERQLAKPDPSRRKPEALIARLEAKRQRILDQNADGLISRERCREQVSLIDRELAEARALLAPQPAPWDAKRVALAVALVFDKFRLLAFEPQRALLERAARDIVLGDDGVLSITLRGGFLGEIGVILGERSRWPC